MCRINRLPFMHADGSKTHRRRSTRGMLWQVLGVGRGSRANVYTREQKASTFITRLCLFKI
jgi:hypothetical protein